MRFHSVIWLASFCLLGSSSAASAQYQIRLLPVLAPNESFGFPLISNSADRINDRGEIIGTSTSTNRLFETVRYNDTFVRAITPSPVGEPYNATALNEQGIVSGFTGTSPRQALLNTPTSTRFLGIPSGANESFAYGLNNRGQSVGVLNENIRTTAFVYQNNQYQRLPGPSGTTFSFANDINDAGRIVGSYAFGNSLQHAFYYENGTYHELRTEIPRINNNGSQATDVNERGDIVGQASTAANLNQAFLYTNNTFIELGSLPGFETSVAVAINEAGQIVGNAEHQEGFGQPTSRPFLYRNGAMIDLSTLLPANSGWSLLRVGDINNQGQIVGAGFYQGTVRGFVIAPVPEPNSVALLSSLLVGIGWLHRRRKTYQG